MLREEGRVGRLIEDTARLLFLFERGLAERGIQIATLSSDSKDATSARAARRLCAELILADDESWQESLRSREGAVPVGSPAAALPQLLAQTAFYKRLVWRSGSGASLPESANVETLCNDFAELRPLKPVLQEVARAAAMSSGN